MKGLSESSRAVVEYAPEVNRELREKECQKVISLGNIRLYECPVSFLEEDTFRMARTVFLAEETGRLFFEGGWAGQPVWFIEAFEIYRAEKAARQGNENG